MASTEVTRLRVAQAARNPVTVEQIVDEVRDDDDAANATAEAVGKMAEDWMDAGVLEELSGGRFVQRRVFESDIERRLVANLATPRNVESLRDALKSDQYVGVLPQAEIERMLRSAEDRGLVKSLGQTETAGALVKKIAADSSTIDLHKDKAEAIESRMDEPVRAWRLLGPQYLMTKLAHDALQVLAVGN